MSSHMHRVPTKLENWKPIVGFEGLYLVSDLGRVFSLERRVLGVVPYKGGPCIRIRRARFMSLKARASARYLMVMLCKDAKETHHLVHRLVLEAFVGPCPAGKQGCHNNGDSRDNRAENLRWDTAKENSADRARHGKTARGSGQGSAKLTPAKVRAIRAKYASGGRTLVELGSAYGVHNSHISRIVLRKDWAHV